MKNIIDCLSEDEIKRLIDNLFPSVEMWFFCEKYDFLDDKYISFVEYLNNYSNLVYNNRYRNWKLKKTARYVVIDNDGWFNKLSLDDKRIVIKNQIVCNRGLIIDSNSDDYYLNDYIYDGKLVLYSIIFNKLSFDYKKNLLFRYLSDYDNLLFYDINISNNYINSISNKYIFNEGFNCLASVLYCITNNKMYLSKWVEDDEFEDYLKEKYMINESIDSYNEGDIIVFKNNESLVHAAYCIRDNFFINKNGQSIYNPVLIKSLSQLKDEWDDCVVYRYVCKE